MDRDQVKKGRDRVERDRFLANMDRDQVKKGRDRVESDRFDANTDRDGVERDRFEANTDRDGARTDRSGAKRDRGDVNTDRNEMMTDRDGVMRDRDDMSTDPDEAVMDHSDLETDRNAAKKDSVCSVEDPVASREDPDTAAPGENDCSVYGGVRDRAGSRSILAQVIVITRGRVAVSGVKIFDEHGEFPWRTFGPLYRTISCGSWLVSIPVRSLLMPPPALQSPPIPARTRPLPSERLGRSSLLGTLVICIAFSFSCTDDFLTNSRSRGGSSPTAPRLGPSFSMAAAQ
jgi:hypothetical protein